MTKQASDLENTMVGNTRVGDALSAAEIAAVAPALAQYAERRLFGDLWKRPGLTPRDRSIVTVAAAIARNQPIELQFQIGLALKHGVKASELSEIITHRAFYSGWGNAMTAVHIAAGVTRRRPAAAAKRVAFPASA